jgi:hypothetical protein
VQRTSPLPNSSQRSKDRSDHRHTSVRNRNEFHRSHGDLGGCWKDSNWGFESARVPRNAHLARDASSGQLSLAKQGKRTIAFQLPEGRRLLLLSPGRSRIERHQLHRPEEPTPIRSSSNQLRKGRNLSTRPHSQRGFSYTPLPSSSPCTRI